VAALFAVTPDAGADGEKSLTHSFALVLSGEGLASTLSVTPTAVGGNPAGLPDDLTIYFYSVDAHTVEGRVGGESGPVALRITLNDPSEAVLGDESLTVEQFLAIDHGDDGNLFDSEMPLYLTQGGSLSVKLTSTLTDGDDDTASDSHSVTLIDGNTPSSPSTTTGRASPSAPWPRPRWSTTRPRASTTTRTTLSSPPCRTTSRRSSPVSARRATTPTWAGRITAPWALPAAAAPW
jgi:hypothetical protein